MIGSGGRIRTSDLWVMSPTSCHCSTPRHEGVGGGRGRGPRRPRLPGGRPPSTLRRCPGSRPGSGWNRVGPGRSRPRAPTPPTRTGPPTLPWRSATRIVPAARSPRPPRGRPPPFGGAGRTNVRRECSLDDAHGSAPVGCPPSTCRRSTRSSPGRLPGLAPPGGLVSGRESRLDAFSGSPVRTWLPSGAGRPTTGSPAVRPSRSSRTRDGPPHTPCAHSG